MMAQISLASQIAEVKREIAMRQQVYPRQVIALKMRQEESEMLIKRMESVLATLEYVQKNEAEFREFAESKRISNEIRRSPLMAG
jgi:hypothetical protein